MAEESNQPCVDLFIINLLSLCSSASQKKKKRAQLRHKGSASAIAQPKQEEALFSPVAVPQVMVEQLE